MHTSSFAKIGIDIGGTFTDIVCRWPDELGLITSKGFRDVLEIKRQSRREIKRVRVWLPCPWAW